MSGGGQQMGYGPSYGQSNQYMGGMGMQPYGGYGGGGYPGQMGGQYNPQRSYQAPTGNMAPPNASGQGYMLGSSQQPQMGIRSQPQSMGISGLPYQPVGGMPQSRAPSMGMNTGGNMLAQAPADSRGMAQPQIGAIPEAPRQAMVPQKTGPAPFTAGWVNPALAQAQNALGQPQDAPSMGGQMANKAYPEGYQFETVPSTLDPGSMNGLQAWLGGSNSPFGPKLADQQQGYTNWYNTTYGQQAPGGPRRY